LRGFRQSKPDDLIVVVEATRAAGGRQSAFGHWLLAVGSWRLGLSVRQAPRPMANGRELTLLFIGT
jgi:hypothetical protein